LGPTNEIPSQPAQMQFAISIVNLYRQESSCAIKTSVNKKMQLNGSEQEWFIHLKDSSRKKYQKNDTHQL